MFKTVVQIVSKTISTGHFFKTAVCRDDQTEVDRTDFCPPILSTSGLSSTRSNFGCDSKLNSPISRGGAFLYEPVRSVLFGLGPVKALSQSEGLFRRVSSATGAVHPDKMGPSRDCSVDEFHARPVLAVPRSLRSHGHVVAPSSRSHYEDCMADSNQ